MNRLESNRLILRKPSKYDVLDYHPILSSPEVCRYSDIPENATKKQTKDFLIWMSKLQKRQSGIAWLICLRDTDIVIGSIRIYKIEKKAACGLLAYEVHPNYWSQGYATEALKLVTNFSHHELKLNRLEAWSNVNNIASDTVLLNNDFEFEGLLKQKVCIRGKLEDIKIFAHLAKAHNNNA